MTIKENFLATIRGEKAERYVNQYEYMELILDPVMQDIGGFALTMQPGTEEVNKWGVSVVFPVGHPGPMPIHTEETTVVKDITKWRECVKAPNVVLPESAWAPVVEHLKTVDRNEKLVTAFTAPGIFEKLHYLTGMTNAFIYFYEEPEAMHELIDFLADWEIELAKEQIKYIHPDVIFHHDDWGTHQSSFISPEMFDEFFTPAYKKVYDYYKENGCIVVHHSDTYAANLVPSMIKMGIDVWQGCISSNNVPELIKKYGGQITFMGGIDSTKVDIPDWTEDIIAKEVEEVCRACGTKYFIPCNCMGGPGSMHEGVYETEAKYIDKMSKIMFK